MSQLYRIPSRRISTSLFPVFNRPMPTRDASEEKYYQDGGDEYGLFGIPELRFPAGFLALRDTSINQCINYASEARRKDRKRKLVEVFDQMSNSLCKIADLAEFVRVSHPLKE